MEANLNQFRLLTVEGEQLANAQRRGSHGDDIGCLKGSPLVKHRLVYEDCPYFDSSKSSQNNDKLRKSSSTRSKDHLSCQLHTSLSHEPAICDHPHHHHRRHHQLCRHLRGITTFQAKSRPRSQSNRQLSLQRDADDDDSRSSRRSLPLSEESEALLQQISCRNKTPQDVFLGLEKRKRSEKDSPEKDEETSTLELVEERIEDDKKMRGEESLISSIKSLEKTMILHCQLLSKRLARERTTAQQKFNGDSKHHNHHQRPIDQPTLAHVTPKSNIRVDKVSVYMRVIFLKIGEIDTMKENFMADAFIQARWREPALDGLQSQLLSAQSMEDIEWDKYWNPKLYVENNLGEPKETIWQTVSYGLKGEATVYERRRIKGCFLENLELDDFPFDTQELTLTITSERSDTELELNEDNIEISSINVQSFVDEQEWALHSHVETWKCITTKIFQNSKLKHPSFSTSCRASRRAGFYIWNIFLVMLFICSLTFATFSVELTKPENRLQLSFILLLTTITFKFVVSQTLPRISYLTYLDKYILTSMGILCGVCVWHAIIPLFKHDAELAKVADKWGLVVFSSCYFLFHLFFFLYIYIMALKRRWKYDQKDKDHKERVRKLQMLQEQQSRLDVVERQNQLLAEKSENPKNMQPDRDKINDYNEPTTATTFGSNNKMDARCDSRLNFENQKATVDDTTLQIYTRHISLAEV